VHGEKEFDALWCGAEEMMSQIPLRGALCRQRVRKRCKNSPLVRSDSHLLCQMGSAISSFLCGGAQKFVTFSPRSNGRGVAEKKGTSDRGRTKRKPSMVPSGPLLVSSTGDAEKTESVREEPKRLFAHPQNLRKAVVCSVELVGGHEGWNPLWNV